MSLQKQQFYEGAALYALVRAGGLLSIRYRPPFFVLNHDLLAFLKYSTKGRSPWGFTFTAEEQELLYKTATKSDIVIGLICGADGVAALMFEDYARISGLQEYAVHVGCFRQHGEHYELKGPDGRLEWKIPPSNWQKILESLR